MTQKRHAQRLFGTDGIRGLVGESPITLSEFRDIGHAICTWLGPNGNQQVVIGHDTRTSSMSLVTALSEGLTAAGADVALVGELPTPAISYFTRTRQHTFGIAVTASHNPYEYNGLKCFDSSGSKLSEEDESSLERGIQNVFAGNKVQASRSTGTVEVLRSAREDYIQHCLGTIAPQEVKRRINLVLDCAHGSTTQVAPSVFSTVANLVDVIGNVPDGKNINNGHGATELTALQRQVVATGADLGIAFDGDGDRVVCVDSAGRILDGDEILYLLVEARRARGEEVAGVVGTSMTNMGLERALASQNVPFIRVPVGDRFIGEALQTRGWSLGGENSGHIIQTEFGPTGDGIVTGLQVLAQLAKSPLPQPELPHRMTKFPQKLTNIECPDNAANRIRDDVNAVVQEFTNKLGEAGRIVVRPSGTEPVLRVMVEASNQDLVDQTSTEIVKSLREQM